MKRAALNSKLTALIADDHFDRKALRLGQSGQPESINLVLQAIDDTMLERDVVFAVDESSMTLRVGGKRVQMMIAATDDLAAPAELFGKPLGSDTPEDLGHLGGVIRNLTARAGHLTLDRKPVEDKKLKSVLGVDIQTLADRWNLSVAVSVPDQMADFLALVTQHTTAMVILSDGEIDDVTGSADAIETLQKVFNDDWEIFAKSHDRFRKSHQGKQLRMLDQLGPPDQAAFVVDIDNRQCAGLLAIGRIPHVAAAWAAALGRGGD